ncbi:MarR family transcriptional regulator [Aromatoleum toluclasticum]|uniref:MarR family winged helix-turn-helix transcriptional regulator n=1 Tax=Aromatoleum toluclasticum TaxID=92003 RepID=UPI001D198356|nr:MarR family transcriptional regulator [Aromatoleum toluclasticum]MCC4115953.1 MarR family transcriptional regulator [Aromatoleum toluclasticum]
MTQKKSTDKKGLDYGMLPSLAGYQLRLAQIAIFRDFSEGLGEFDVTPGLFGILVIIECNSGLKQTELARAAHLDRSTVVSVIDNLERRSLVERRPAENDRRSNSLVLTTDGSALLKKLKRRVQEHEKRLVEHLSEDERVTLVSLLQKIFPEHR